MSGRHAFRGARARPRRTRGFTLFEILIAIAIFAVLGLAANRLLGQIVRADETTREHSVRLAGLQHAMAILERDALQAVARGVRDELGGPRPAMQGGVQELLEFTRLGWRNPLSARRAELQRVAYLLEGRKLLRLYWPVLDRADGSLPIRQVLLEDVDSVSVEFVTGDGQRSSFWPLQAAGDAGPGSAGEAAAGALPRALRWSLEVKPFGNIERLFVLPDTLPRSALPPSGGGPGGGPGDGSADGQADDASADDEGAAT